MPIKLKLVVNALVFCAVAATMTGHEVAASLHQQTPQHFLSNR